MNSRTFIAGAIATVSAALMLTGAVVVTDVAFGPDNTAYPDTPSQQTDQAGTTTPQSNDAAPTPAGSTDAAREVQSRPAHQQQP